LSGSMLPCTSVMMVMTSTTSSSSSDMMSGWTVSGRFDDADRCRPLRERLVDTAASMSKRKSRDTVSIFSRRSIVFDTGSI
jgi:hypothetical protein